MSRGNLCARNRTSVKISSPRVAFQSHRSSLESKDNLYPPWYTNNNNDDNYKRSVTPDVSELETQGALIEYRPAN